ncbi:MAG: hypothetical protein FWE84_03575 [Firmicutes bacterium]|nr:hypothetical protein [Bacillota bacterium]
MQHRIALFVLLIITTVLVAFVYIFSDTAAVVVTFVLSPIVSPLLAIFLLADRTLVPTFIILCLAVYELVFWLTACRLYKGADRQVLKYGLNAAIAAALCLCLGFCECFISTPNLNIER